MNPSRRPPRPPEWPGWAALTLLTVFMFYMASAPASMFPRMAPVLPWDKFVHGGEWAAWSALLMAVLRRRLPGASVDRLFLWTTGSAAVGALLHELYQIPIPGRSCDPLDWTADMIGGILAAALCARLIHYLQTRRAA